MRKFSEMLNTPIAFLAVVVVLVVAVNSFLYFGYYLPSISENSPAEGDSPVVVGAGDIASCSNANDEATAELLDDIDGTVITLGDNAYEKGSGADFRECYDPTWGRYKHRTRPIPGNHEYDTPGAREYFDYFGEAAGDPSQGYYSYDIGEWHVVALNSECWEVGGCRAPSPQVRWLKADLAANRTDCTLALMHKPLFNSGKHGTTPLVKPLWQALYAANADVVLSGHDHNYQRYAPQDPSGKADPGRGLREFVVGTGGKSHYAIKAPPLPNTEVYNDETYGVLKLTLHPEGYDWKFLPVVRKNFTDSESDRCH